MSLSFGSRGARNLFAGAALSTLVIGAAAPMAFAYGGKEEPNTNPGGVSSPGAGLVWGNDQEGTYFLDTVDGKTVQGFCIDPGVAYPRQDGGTKYTGPQTWEYGNGLTGQDRTSLAAALVLGKEINDGGGKAWPMSEKLGLGKNLDANAAAASAVVHRIGSGDTTNSDAPGWTAWSEESRLPADPEVRKSYDRLNSITPEEFEEATGFKAEDVKFQVYMPENDGHQRMLFVDAPVDKNDKPLIPKKPDNPDESTEPDEPSTSTSTSTKTSTSSTTPETTEETTPETTPGTTSKTTPKTTPTTTPAPENPKIRTSAGEKSENIIGESATITDTVSYEGLTPGEEYEITGVTVDKNTGRIIEVNQGSEVFTPTSESGTVDVEIPINDYDSSEMVVFETLVKDGTVVAEHKDINDEAQTVGKPQGGGDNENPQIRTSADSSTGNVIQSGTTITDTVSYSGLVPGETYVLEARMMCKADGSDTGASQTHEFIPSSSSGQEKVTGIAVTRPDCTEQVAFEKLYDDEGFLVTSHEDITDAAQTVGGGRIVKKAPAPQPAQARASANANSQQPGGMGGGTPLPNPGPRQIITAVPAGGSDGHGSTIFTR